MARARTTPDPRDAGVHRFFGLGPFAVLKGVPYDDLVHMRHSERCWVPSPDIEIGDRAGWSLPCINLYRPYGRPFRRPPVRRFDDATAMMERFAVSRDTLWRCIEDGSIPGPVVWIDDQPGFEKRRS